MADEDGGLTGDWRGALNLLGGLPDRLTAAIRLATRQNAVGLEGEIKKGMISQAPGGEPYTPLHPFTIRMRVADKSYRGLNRDASGKFLKRGQGGASHKALIAHGDLLGSITHAISSDGLSAAVGVDRNAKAKDGHDVVNIARVVFYGAVIPVTVRMRMYLHSKGLHLKKGTTHIIIPPRETIEPAYRAYRPQIVGRYAYAVAHTIRPG